MNDQKLSPLDQAQADWHAETLAVRTGHQRTAFGEHSEPIFTTSSFVFASAAEAAARFSGDDDGYIYSRFSNPTVAAFEKRLALLEGGEAAIATASGMSAILGTVLSLLSQGDHIVATHSLFGSTVNLFQKWLPRLGMEVDFVSIDNPSAWAAAIRSETKMFFVETPTNPLVQLADIEALAAITQPAGIKLVVDNCFCTPAIQQPLALGADIVIHSATKYLDGQGRCLGGAVVGPSAFIDEQLYGYMRSAGPTLSPFNAWVFLKGLETLSLRMERHCQNAATLAQWLVQRPEITAVHYPGLEDFPQRELARRQMSLFGGVVSLEVRGGQAAAWRLIDSLELLSITANLGDAKTTITHPETTTHARMDEADRRAVGITPGLIRIAAGLEHVNDLIADLEQALAKAVA
ncbi:MAG: O-succinylhomoserine sulfhydrylase [Gammaproteobacteria bacterium]|nr:O-succinylhomoserine sulfhydrylase [Gammaproteobacteria bacterium]